MGTNVFELGETLLDRLFRRYVEFGSFELVFPSGMTEIYGPSDGRDRRSGPAVRVRLTGRSTPWRFLLDPEMEIGEAYMAGRLVVEDGSLVEFLHILMAASHAAQSEAPLRAIDGWRRLRKRFDQFNPASVARRNVAHHYDLDDRLYDLFLDREKYYSCAYFRTPDMTIEAAQAAKAAHIAAKLCLKRGQRVVDIGCGWGALAIAIAKTADVSVLGVTLSERQLRIARERAVAEGLDDRVTFELVDYRDIDGQFDRIVSVGMFEHVGGGHHQQFFDTVRALLAPGGVALLHSIGRVGPPGATNPWVAKYIFPGGALPSLSEVMPAVERSRLVAGDIEILRLHYAHTLAAWSRRFAARRDEARAIYDERFCRMWEFYLAASEAAFRVGDLMVFQMQLLDRVDAAPLTRDYLYADQPAAPAWTGAVRETLPEPAESRR